MRKLNKRALYEKIMHNVSKEVKRSLNEELNIDDKRSLVGELTSNEVYFVAWIYGVDRLGSPMYGDIMLFNDYDSARDYIKEKYPEETIILDWVIQESYQISYRDTDENNIYLQDGFLYNAESYPEYEEGTVEISVSDIHN